MSLALRILATFGSIAVLIIISSILDRRWRVNNPQDTPFKWGYFQALCFFPAGLLWLTVPFFMYGLSSPFVWLYAFVYGIAGSFAGYTLIVKKKRWAWVFVVIAQFNLINWAINYYYGSRRWREFR
jgi:hypothetical protein